ncbi:enoyl-CoA hydratase [Corynebacterium liangguodongii]|uniref:Enoyl-CoA hydratase n=1 Tax=Corynebacterium liangguodongii TaxID=2079535 RepID=A0A2S0WH83_9CORY|nr:enoyl-CoA hydratase [Corynebacterium liangguodongii]PWB99773.1 enoyl-CoA hydratase [Corynebacterium liangguodongii]
MREQRGRITLLTINRHERRNALTVELVRELRDAIQASASRAIVLTGAGSAFCAGADLKDGLGGEFFAEFERLIHALRRHSAPIIAHVNGPAIGAGMMLTMACDIRVAAETARFALPVADMAIGVDGWVASSLVGYVGASRARAMLIAGAPLPLGDAVSCGYVTAGESERAVEIAEVAAAKAPLTVRNIKAELAPDLFSADERSSFRDAAMSSPDFLEAAAARREGRAPLFTGLEASSEKPA